MKTVNRIKELQILITIDEPNLENDDHKKNLEDDDDDKNLFKETLSIQSSDEGIFTNI